ncbi:hypothetical protein DUNSADRAFT_15304 [Dunaliella salina]|uniref:Uncharacterized protein n=1 Tax=Dunaliella salina TaxID=3046 RepID=A0ABQ7G5N3_DUNSA|nr:hypothetical protein DUNSADRAFT_15304 [Dunaliella salina]|eukprot:KAF5829924.1 hypothetical protein DUNSADRAFT_15304 [Dunaliella salina]
MVLDFVLLLLKKALAWLHSSPNSILGIALTLGLWALFRSRNRNNNNRGNNSDGAASAPASDHPNSARGREAGDASRDVNRLQQQQEHQGASTSCDSQEGVAVAGGSGATGSPRGGDGTGVWAGGGAGKGGQLQAKLRGLRRASDVYMLAQVMDDVGQAVITGALEAAGLIGPQPTQLPPQRLLFCSTHPGKQSMVRQIEPDLHVDSDARTVEDLRRFVPQLLWVGTEGAPASGSCAASLVEFFHSS